MEENKKIDPIESADVVAAQEEENSFNLANIFALVVLNWQWFMLSLFIFVCGALIYLRYADAQYQMSVKMLIKDENNGRRSGGQMLADMQDLGFMTNSTGIDNEVEILKSRILALQAVKDLGLYTEYYLEGRVKDPLVYKYQPFTVTLDDEVVQSTDDNSFLIELSITEKDGQYAVEGTTINQDKQEGSFSATLTTMPGIVETAVGKITVNKNPLKKGELPAGRSLLVKIYPPKVMAARYASKLKVEPTSKVTSIAQLTIKDENSLRASDYLLQLAECYNRQANADKNEIAYKTEEFINSRLEKINAELGATEGELQDYKERHNLVQLRLDATQTLAQSTQYYDKLTQAKAQLELLDYLREYVNNPQNNYQIIPSNVGLSDNVSSSLISQYNTAVLERNRMLAASSENSPQVITITNTLDRLLSSIKDALVQARRSCEITRQSIQQQYDLYQSRVASTPEQERILTQIGRQQEVKSGLYLMLLQKREENSISLAATADKGKLIDEPIFGGKVSPKGSIILLAALVLGFAIPLVIAYLLQLLRYKIEGHEDVVRLTRLPIVADVAVASDSVKTAAGIVVHENTNNQIDEIFRSMRTNIQFMMKESDKVILFTSSTSGEGKTFNAANLGVSFALLGKKVLLMGVDIRKPALGRLFDIADRSTGITTLLTKDQPTVADIKSQIKPSGVNANLDLLLAGPTPPNPTELLARETLTDIMTVLRKEYDYIIMDTAPVGLVTDTLQLAKHVDVSVFVCRADYTPKSSFGLINGLANDSKLPNMCIVLNGVDMSKKKYGYYYGYGKYGKYGRYGYGRYGYGKYGYGKYGYGNYGNYGNYGSYGSYGNYANSHYGKKDDDSIKK